MFHHVHLPRDGPFWQAVRPHLTLVWHDPAVIERAEGRCLSHYAHVADWRRLRALNEYGGLYMDMDTLSLRPLPAALRSTAGFIIGRQLPPRETRHAVSVRPCTRTSPTTWRCDGGAASLSRTPGLCNAVMAAAPSSHFGRHWQAQYAHFRSGGRDALWDEHSVVLPARLHELCGGSTTRGAGVAAVEDGAASAASDDVVVMPPQAFYPFTWLEATQRLRETRLRSDAGASRKALLRGTYIMHLFKRGVNAMSGGGGARSIEPPSRPTEPCSSAYAHTLYGSLSCGYVVG